MAADLYHVTLETGDVAMIPASHVGDARHVLEAIYNDLAQGRPASIPPTPGWRVTAGMSPGKAISVMVQRQSGNDWVGVVWFAVSIDRTEGKLLWQALHRIGVPPGAKLATDPGRQPSPPWVGSRMLPGAITCNPDDLSWIADFTGRFAWVWIEKQTTPPAP